MSQELSEQQLIRRKSLEELRKLGINPYPAEMYHFNAYSTDVIENFDKHESEKTELLIAGRITNRRIMGKASFAEIQDAKGKIQIYLNRDVICPDEDKTMYNTVFKKLLDIGDIIGVKGEVFKTQTGEISIKAKEFKLGRLQTGQLSRNNRDARTSTAKRNKGGGEAKYTETFDRNPNKVRRQR